MSKQYRLILPNHQKNSVLTKEVLKPSIFDESSSSESQDGSGSPPKLRKNNLAIGPSAMKRRIARSVQKKALAENPTIFQYDELYDDMANKRPEEQLAKRREPKQAKYIMKLIGSTEKRKLEHELCIERQVQKEREAEGGKFKDKESFVTTTYRKKLEEMRKLEEQSKRDDYLENVGDLKLLPTDEDEKVGADENGRKTGKGHLTNNIGDDLDFSIDDSSSDACSNEDESTEKTASP
uniref:Nuclear speckle splicing regulatory protein 1 N-terminal domain-containing protein n=1 Tax=Glossina palpalis gambiensis TaxID=67801 RepID=A0A1B0ALS8_9MUSC